MTIEITFSRTPYLSTSTHTMKLKFGCNKFDKGAVCNEQTRMFLENVTKKVLGLISSQDHFQKFSTFHPNLHLQICNALQTGFEPAQNLNYIAL